MLNGSMIGSRDGELLVGEMRAWRPFTQEPCSCGTMRSVLHGGESGYLMEGSRWDSGRAADTDQRTHPRSPEERLLECEWQGKLPIVCVLMFAVLEDAEKDHLQFAVSLMDFQWSHAHTVPRIR